jgi:hypothetical protein
MVLLRALLSLLQRFVEGRKQKWFEELLCFFLRLCLRQ